MTAAPRPGPDVPGNALHREFTVFSRYLLGGSAPERARDLYIAAVRVREADLGGSQPSGPVRLAVRRPFLLPFLDAGLALRCPRAALRQRLLVLSAILEVLPELSDRYLPPPPSRFGLLWACVAAGLGATAKALVGLPLSLLEVRCGGR